MNYTPTPQQYLTQNFSIIPLRLDGSKAPSIPWRQYQEQQATEVEIDQWFLHSEAGIGVVTGKISGNLLVIDFDHDADKVFPQFWNDISKECPEITEQVLVVQTPRPGIQVWIRQTFPVGRSQVLAYTTPRASVDDSAVTAIDSDTAQLQPQVMIETRGEGGYIVAPGSPVDVHPNRTPYQIDRGSLDCLSTLTAEQIERVLNLCRSYNRFTPQNVQRQPGEKYTGTPRPGDIFNEHADLRQLMLDHGWTVDHENADGVVFLKRPGKTAPGSSATLGYLRDDGERPLLYVFSSNASPFKSGHGYDAFAAFALLKHHGNYSEAAAASRSLYLSEVEQAQSIYVKSQHNALGTLCAKDVPYKPFPVNCLPETIGSYVSECADSIGIDKAFVGVPMLPVLAAAIGGSRSLLVKRDWEVPSILWAMIIGDVSSGKSPGFDAAMKPLVQIENALHFRRQSEDHLHEQLVASYEQAKSEGAKNIAKPKQQRSKEQVLINDFTMESLADVASNNCKLLCEIDEGASFIKQFNQYRPGRDIENWLTIYNGGGININRKTDKLRIWIPRTYISVCGTTQPAVATSVIFTQEFLDNGLAARILSARPPSKIVRWSEKEVHPSITEAACKLVLRLYLLKGDGDACAPCPKRLICSEEAQKLYIQWINDTADYAESMEVGLKTSWVKIRPVAARLALILSVTRQLMESPDGQALQPVDAQSMQAGIELARWFGYELERNAARSELKTLYDQLNWIISKHPAGIDTRTFQMGRREIRTADDARRILNSLTERGCGQIVDNRFLPSL